MSSNAGYIARVLNHVQAGPYTIRGVSIGGVYTTLQIPELASAFDCGMATRSSSSVKNLFLSHGHADHSGALIALLGIRSLNRGQPPLRVFLPAEIEEPMLELLHKASELQRWELSIETVPMRPGDTFELRRDRSVRAFKTFHPVPSLGYQFFQRVNKLRPEFAHLPGREIGARRKAGHDLFDTEEHLELAYATDTLARVLRTEPSLLETKVLILECTFLDAKKSLEAARAGCHIHLDELLEMADEFQNEHLVLMHFSQMYSPNEVRELLRRRCPPQLYERIIAFAPEREWQG